MWTVQVRRREPNSGAVQSWGLTEGQIQFSVDFKGSVRTRCVAPVQPPVFVFQVLDSYGEGHVFLGVLHGISWGFGMRGVQHVLTFIQGTLTDMPDP